MLGYRRTRRLILIDEQGIYACIEYCLGSEFKKEA